MRWLFDDDPITGVSQEFEESHDGKEFTIATMQDIEPVLQRNLDLRNCFDERADWKGDVHHVASIPNVVMDDLFRKGIAQDPERFKQWLNDPDNRMFRTRPGKV